MVGFFLLGYFKVNNTLERNGQFWRDVQNLIYFFAWDIFGQTNKVYTINWYQSL